MDTEKRHGRPGRPKGTINPDRAHKRTIAFPPALYAEIQKIASREERDVTAQIIIVLREFLARYQRENKE